MRKKYILGLDISTSTVGISLFDIDGNLIELNHISPISKCSAKHEELFEKSQIIVDFLTVNYEKDIDSIIIESPLISSKQFDTAALLNYFAGIMFASLKKAYKDCTFHYITVDEARRFGLSELVGGKNKTLFGELTKNLKDVEVSELKKMAVLSSVAQKFPDIVWLLNNNLTIDKKNFDRADSITVVLGHMEKTKNTQFAVQPKTNITQTEEFIRRNNKYELFIKSLDKKLTKDEKDKLKYDYLKNVFQIENYINVAI